MSPAGMEALESVAYPAGKEKINVTNSTQGFHYASSCQKASSARSIQYAVDHRQPDSES